MHEGAHGGHFSPKVTAHHIIRAGVGVDDRRVKFVDVEDHRIKGGIDCSSHEQPTG